MNIVIISDHFIISNSLKDMLSKDLGKLCGSINCFKTLNEIKNENIEDIDYILMYITQDSIYNLEAIGNLKKINSNLKIIIIDMEKDENTLILSMKSDVDGYISSITDENDFKHIMNKIMSGAKYYESELIKIIVNKGRSNKSIDLTKREKEILFKIAEGCSNKDISDQLYIAESTTKKHITNLLSKLNLNSRSEMANYAHKNSIYL